MTFKQKGGAPGFIIPNQDGIYAWNKEQQTRESMVDKQ